MRIPELGNMAINRILFVLALLGVLLPLNSLATRYSHVGFVYYAPHELTLKGPYDLHILAFYYIMEGLLAAAVYVYAFLFIFGTSLFQLGGNLLFTLALLAPPAYLYLWCWSAIIRAVNHDGPVIYWFVITVTELFFGILLAVMFVAIARRLQE